MGSLAGILVRHQSLGVGKVLGVEGNAIRVRFLTGDQAEACFSSAAGALQHHELLPGQRCAGPGGDCVVRALHRATDGGPHRYDVVYEGNRRETVAETELTPLQTSPPAGPLDVLAGLCPDGYTVFRARERLAEAAWRALREGAGLRALLASRIDLRPHQAYVAGVVLRDRRRRYMLADEVGLGKTIEAGIVIHDLLSQKPGARVLIICPGALTHQWLAELYAKFGGHTFKVLDLHEAKAIHSPDLKKAIVSTTRLLDDMAPKVEAVAWDMVVVDEAHHLLSSRMLYEMVQRLGRRASALLLLSAIPAQRREDEFLRLLALLEPNRYEIEAGRRRFAELYAAQTDIGRRLRILSRRVEAHALGDASSEDITDAARRLVDSPVVRDDAELAALVAEWPSAPGDFAEHAHHVLQLVADRYRVNRRILRNRRERLIEQERITRIERTRELCPYPPDQLEIDAARALHRLLNSIADAGCPGAVLLPLARILLQSLVSPQATHSVLMSLGTILDKTRPGQRLNARAWDLIAQGHLVGPAAWDLYVDLVCAAVRDFVDRSRLAEALEAVGRWRRSKDRPRQEALIEILTERLASNPRNKFLVFAGFAGVVHEAIAALRQRFGVSTITEFHARLSDTEKEVNVLRFRSRSEIRVLVSDESGGEGRNFQFAAALVHYDTPWHVARVEQRIGRLDRLGREEFRPDVCSTVLFAEGSLEEALVRCWDEGLGVYRRSVSGLEFALRDVEDRLASAALAHDGPEALGTLAPEMARVAGEERARDESEAVLDEASFERRAAETLLRLSQRAGADDELARAFVDYIRFLAPDAVWWLDDSDLDARVCRVDLEKVPRNRLDVGQGTVGTDFRAVGTFRRDLAQRKPSLAFFTFGNPIFDAVIGSLTTQPTGRTYAVEVECVGVESWRGFEFVFRAEPSVELGRDPIALVNLAKSLFFARPVHVFVRDDGAVEPQSEHLQDIREGLRDEDKGRTWWNLTKDRAQRLRDLFGEKPWSEALSDLYAAAAAHARALLAERFEQVLLLELRRLDEQARQAQRSSEAGVEQELAAIRRLREAITNWRPELDAVGFLGINSGLRKTG